MNLEDEGLVQINYEHQFMNYKKMSSLIYSIKYQGLKDLPVLISCIKLISHCEARYALTQKNILQHSIW